MTDGSLPCPDNGCYAALALGHVTSLTFPCENAMTGCFRISQISPFLLALSLLMPTQYALAAGLVLVTPQEAALPQGDVPKSRSISRGPTIEVVSPKGDNATIKSPIELKISFEPHGGKTINTASVQVLYVKSKSVDLTQRVAPYITEKGLAISAAELPPGNHMIAISVDDSDKKRTTKVVNITVDP